MMGGKQTYKFHELYSLCLSPYTDKVFHGTF